MNSHYVKVQEETEALHDRTIRLRLPANFSALFFLREGALRWDENEREIEAPALCYWPQQQCPILSMTAGGRSSILGLSDTLVSDAIGARAESVHMRMLAEHPFVTPLADAKMLQQVQFLFEWFSDEVSQAERQSPMSLSAYLRLLFIAALRAHQPEPLQAGTEQTNILRKFRHLVELHYRDHWQVRRFAEELGVNYDRLHRICKRETGRSAAELVHERLTAEAKARLENTGFPLKKIAADLGFSDATRFSHFFKRRTAMSPGAYRTVVSRPHGDDLVELRRGFSDWP